jgi:hypothetical protein
VMERNSAIATRTRTPGILTTRFGRIDPPRPVGMSHGPVGWGLD